MAGRWVSVNAAAEALDTSTDAIRKRIQRRTLVSEKQDGRVMVWLDAGGMGESEALKDELVEVLRDEVAHLRRESERKDEIIMSLSMSNAEMSRTIRAIEAPDASPGEQNPPDSGQEPRSEGSTTPESAEGEIRRPWWRRIWE